MPSMPRSNKKATKIAYALIGKPVSMQGEGTRSKKKINRVQNGVGGSIYTYTRLIP